MIFRGKLFKNSQVTLPKEVRDGLGIRQNDLVFLEVIRVLSPDGKLKWEKKEEKEEANAT